MVDVFNTDTRQKLQHGRNGRDLKTIRAVYNYEGLAAITFINEEEKHHKICMLKIVYKF